MGQLEEHLYWPQLAEFLWEKVGGIYFSRAVDSGELTLLSILFLYADSDLQEVNYVWTAGHAVPLQCIFRG